MRQLTLSQAERFHGALRRTCAQYGLDMRYLGALAHPSRPGLQPTIEPAVWSVHVLRPPADALSLAPAPELLFCIALGTASSPDAFTLRVADTALFAKPLSPAGRRRGSWRVALRNHGVDADKFAAMLKQEAARR